MRKKFKEGDCFKYIDNGGASYLIGVIKCICDEGMRRYISYEYVCVYLSAPIMDDELNKNSVFFAESPMYRNSKIISKQEAFMEIL
jgi:hypothetical protein